MANAQTATAHASGPIRLTSSLNVILGAWLIIAPFVFNSSTPAFWNDIVVGALVLILAAVRISKPQPSTRAASWTNAGLGVWLVIAPFVLNYSVPAAGWNDIVVGILIAGFALWSGSLRRML